MSAERELQAIADRQHLKSAVDDMGPRDYAVLVRFKHADPEGKTGSVLVHRGCFRHVAIGLLDEAMMIMRGDDDTDEETD